MKYTIHQQSSGEDELVLYYQTMNDDVERVLAFMNDSALRLVGKIGEETISFEPKDLLYIETVDEHTFAYLSDQVIKLDLSLSKVKALLTSEEYFRCSKSMIVNINKVSRLRSLSSNRIDAVLENDEHIIISRTYASDFRRLLKGGL